MISIIMPSYLGAYKKAAVNREQKIIRAVNSVINQTYQDWELVIVADGCQRTVDILKESFSDPRIKGYLIPKQKIWSGVVRNYGLDRASGEWACYLDIDDVWGNSHLSSIAPQLGDRQWYWFNDYVLKDNLFHMRQASIGVMGRCGTSNVIHRKDLARWNEKDSYAHDWNFIKNLKSASKKYAFIKAGKYYVCHIPGKMDI